MRYLGVDPGGRRMGLAVGDSLTGIVSPLEVVSYRGAQAAARFLADAAERLGVGCFVLGLPTLADGSVGPAARRTEVLAAELRALGLEVDFQGEFLSTDEARRRARAAGRPPGRPVDDLAAQVILEEYLASPNPASTGKE
ncbi:MAG: Holliday junction resolvase RuvX [Acidobacteria bacterium]|nr:Holliday junction resolvase RuvX [Acidobacteriota bacterium]